MADLPCILWLMESPDHSGISFAAAHMAAGLLRVGYGLRIFAMHDGENSEEFRHLGCPVGIYPHFGKRIFGSVALAAARDAGVEIVHALTPELIKRGMRIAKSLRRPLVVTGNRLETSELRMLAAFRGQGIIAVSDAIRERLVTSEGVQQGRIKVIPNCLDLSRMPKPDFNHHGAPIPGRVPVVGTLGQLAERKGQRVFLQAVRILLDRGFDAEFVILGDGPDRGALRDLAEELQVAKRVTFTPRTVSGQLTQLDLLVEPSLHEGFGLSVMQAMAMGVPVVGTGVGGLYSLIKDGKTGLMVQANNPEALADAIWRILNNREERLEMARQARELIEKRFDADLVAEQLGHYYLKLLDEFNGW